MTENEKIRNRDACLPYVDKVTEWCDKNGTPLSNRQREFVMDSMAEMRQSLSLKIKEAYSAGHYAGHHGEYTKEDEQYGNY